MAMSMVLEGVRDFLRQENGWKAGQCEIQQGATPTNTSRGMYVALDDAGVDTAAADQHYLKEIYSIEIAIWTETGSLPADLSGQAQLKADKYTPGRATLHKLERRIIAQLHQKQEPRNQINAEFGLPGSDGCIFLMPLVYGGRPKNETFGAIQQGAQNVAQWLGRRLRFRGFDRTQKIGSVK